ncbi:hypothetical protein ACP4OV_008981 [Aristida adscensionis]
MDARLESRTRHQWRRVEQHAAAAAVAVAAAIEGIRRRRGRSNCSRRGRHASHGDHPTREFPTAPPPLQTMGDFGDELFLEVGDDGLGEIDYVSFSESIDGDLGFPRHLLSTEGLELGTLIPDAGSPFSFGFDPDFRRLSPLRPPSPPFLDCLEDGIADAFEWEEVADAAPGVGGGLDGSGAASRAMMCSDSSTREMLAVMEGIDSGDDESIFSDEPPFDFGDDDGELDGIFGSVGWEMLPVPLDEDEFEVLPGHLADAAAGGAPPAARATVERLQVVVVGAGEEASQGCAVCKDGIAQGELARRLPRRGMVQEPTTRPTDRGKTGTPGARPRWMGSGRDRKATSALKLGPGGIWAINLVRVVFRSAPRIRMANS